MQWSPSHAQRMPTQPTSAPCAASTQQSVLVQRHAAPSHSQPAPPQLAPVGALDVKQSGDRQEQDSSSVSQAQPSPAQAQAPCVQSVSMAKGEVKTPPASSSPHAAVSMSAASSDTRQVTTPPT